MRVLKGLLVSLEPCMPPHQKSKPSAVSAALGGERQRSSASSETGYFETAQRIGKRAYLEPIRDSMQLPIEGLLGNAENVEGRVAIG